MNLGALKNMKRRLARRFSRSSGAILATASQIINDDWYFSRYPAASKVGISALEHYLHYGADQNYDPCPMFWTKWYRETYKDVEKERLNPLLHYLQHGGFEGRDPSPLFNSSWYSDTYALMAINPLVHYLTVGKEQNAITRPEHTVDAHRLGILGPSVKPIDNIRTIIQKAGKSGQEAFYHGPLQSCFSWLSAKGKSAHDVSLTALGAPIAAEMENLNLFARTPYYAYIDDATIIPGSGTIIASDGAVLNDEIVFVNQRFGIDAIKLIELNWLHDNDLLIKYKADLSPTLQSGIHLFKEHEQNYFHFTYELALKLHLIEREKLVPSDIPLLISDDLSSQLYELIALIKHPDRRIIKLKRNVPYRVDQLFYLSDISRIVDAYETAPDNTFTFMSLSLMADFARYVKKELGEDKNTVKRRIYLTCLSERRSLVNQPDIIHRVLEQGFETASLELFNFPSQVKIMSEASVVIGATGAAFTNLLWCAPGTKVLILYPDHPFNNRTFWNYIGQAAGLDIHYLDGERQGRHVGKYGIHDDFKIDVRTFDHAINSFMPVSS